MKSAKVFGIPRLGTESQLVRTIRVPDNISDKELENIGKEIADMLCLKAVKIVVR